MSLTDVVTVGVDYARLLVTWQDPATRAFWRIGVLSHSTESGYEFAYVSGVESVDGFVPFVGLDDLSRTYVSSKLFPVFAERMMDPGRMGFDTWLQHLHLEPSAHPMEMLAKSHGSRGSDTVQLFSVPPVRDDGFSQTQFFVNGVRHVEGASELIDSLVDGQALDIEEHLENTWDARALIVSKDRGHLGYIPGPLLDYVQQLRGSSSCALKVVQVNPREVGSHFRLLVEISGDLPSGFKVLDSMMSKPI